MFNLTLSRLGEGGAESARVGFYKLISPKPRSRGTGGGGNGGMAHETKKVFLELTPSCSGKKMPFSQQ
jgi:hypothetical protein